MFVFVSVLHYLIIVTLSGRAADTWHFSHFIIIRLQNILYHLFFYSYLIKHIFMIFTWISPNQQMDWLRRYLCLNFYSETKHAHCNENLDHSETQKVKVSITHYLGTTHIIIQILEFPIFIYIIYAKTILFWNWFLLLTMDGRVS